MRVSRDRLRKLESKAGIRKGEQWTGCFFAGTPEEWFALKREHEGEYCHLFYYHTEGEPTLEEIENASK